MLYCGWCGMTDRQPHLYTLHFTYTGAGCAMCGQSADAAWHDQTKWQVDGKIVEQGGDNESGTTD